MSISQKTLDEIALTKSEYNLIVAGLGREPNRLELGIFGSMWSEHCGYKHSKSLLKLLPSTSPRVLLPVGGENAGAVDIGDGLAIVFKIESHNHPSAVEPFQGAATGVGGIVRDILSMGARPIALLNSLRFGPLDDPHNRYLLDGVVGGISWYGNCIGVPDIGGEINFSESYNHNPLVNALCVGLLKKDELVRASAGDEGNILLLVGAPTGRDGIHGASGLASRTFEEEQEMRPTVQAANPFLEKVLIEACLEATTTGELEGMQDLGAAGLTSSSFEAASRSNVGLELYLSRVHRRDSNMGPYEIMLSESQERMLLIVKQGMNKKIKAVMDNWSIPYVEVGKVIREKETHLYDDSTLVGQLPMDIVTNPPKYTLRGKKSAIQKELQKFPLKTLPFPTDSPSSVLIRLLSSPNIANKASIYQQYDHHVQTNTVVEPGGDAALLRIKGTPKGIALSTDGNSRYCFLDPYNGGSIAVAEACRNVSCVGAEPIALTDCLNFGNPENPEVYYQLEWCIKGMARACRILNVPVISGNVSLYNETRGEAIYPTPVIGALGLLEDIRQHVTSDFKKEGELVVLIGQSTWKNSTTSFAGSEYLERIHHLVAGRPLIDLQLESRVQAFCRNSIREGLVSAAHDCSDGGLGVALAEACITGNMGFTGTVDIQGRWDSALFGESQSRILATVQQDLLPQLQQRANESKIPMIALGFLTGDRLIIPNFIDIPIAELANAWENGVKNLLAQ